MKLLVEHLHELPDIRAEAIEEVLARWNNGEKPTDAEVAEKVVDLILRERGS